MDVTQMFPIYVNVFNFTWIWMKLFAFAQMYLKQLDGTQMLLIEMFLILPET